MSLWGYLPNLKVNPAGKVRLTDGMRISIIEMKAKSLNVS
jgi:hypothetical protein